MNILDIVYNIDKVYNCKIFFNLTYKISSKFGKLSNGQRTGKGQF